METNTDKHPRTITGYDGSFKELAQAIGSMSYDRVAEFLSELAANIEAQADNDLKKRGRKKLSQELYEAVEFTKKAQAKIQSAWKVCEPYMQK